jgi:hypothetical protein
MTGSLGFAAFDLLVDGRYLDWPDLRELLARSGIPGVPVLYEGPLTAAAVREHAEGPTTLGGGNIREGVVIRPVQERTDARVGRVVLKYLSDAYLLDEQRSDFTEQ